MDDNSNPLDSQGPVSPSWLSTSNPLASLNPGSNPLGDAIAPPTKASTPHALSPPAPSAADAIEQRMWGQESGHRQFHDNGEVVTSRAGAIGYTQVMPSTGPEAAKLAGLPWDENRLSSDTEYNKALGHAYYRAQVAKYGDPVVAAAAYNAGPQAVDRALTNAKQTGQPWTSFLPAETQDYVATVSGQKPGGTQSAGGNSAQGAIPQEPSAQSGQLKGLLQLALIQAAFPQHKFTPIDYDPMKVRPVVGGPVV